MSTQADSLQSLVSKYINTTNRSVFLTGKAGTGKTTLLHRIKEHTHKNMVVTAPTGIAAINAGGVTLHSCFNCHLGLLFQTITALTQTACKHWRILIRRVL